MALARGKTYDDYWPSYSTFLLQDAGGDGEEADLAAFSDPEEGPLGEYYADWGFSDLAVAGAGWLTGSTCNDHHLVRLELHDAEPPHDIDGWDDVVVTPYLSETGRVTLSTVCGAPEGPVLELAGAGRYLVRVCRRPRSVEQEVVPADEVDLVGEGEQSWRLQFWPDPAGSALPRRLRRSGPAAPAACAGWDVVLAADVMDLVWVVSAAADECGHPDGALGEQIAAWGEQHGRGLGWWNTPIDQPDNGMPDSQIGWARLAEHVHGELPASPEVAVDLLVSVGQLERAGHPARYRPVSVQPPVESRLALTPQEESAVRRRRSDDTNSYLLADIVGVAAWAQVTGVRTLSISGLAELLLASSVDIRGALESEACPAVLSLGGDLSTDGPLSVQVLPRDQDEFRGEMEPQRDETPWWLHDPRVDAPPAPDLEPDLAGLPSSIEAGRFTVIVEFEPDGATTDPAPPLGAPARAGVVMEDGRVVIPCDGGQVVVATVPLADPVAYRTVTGTLLHERLGPLYLVGDDGRVTHLADDVEWVTVSGDGRLAVVHRSKLARRARTVTNLDVLRLDPAARPRLDPLAWPSDREVTLLGLHGRTLYLYREEGIRSGDGSSLRWQLDDLGAVPQPAEITPGVPVDTIDPVSGTLACLRSVPRLVVRPGGSAFEVEDDFDGIVPGGAAGYVLSAGQEFALRRFDGEDMRRWPLPDGVEVAGPPSMRPCWEGGEQVILMPHTCRGFGWPLRLNLHDGSLERIDVGCHDVAVAAVIVPMTG